MHICTKGDEQGTPKTLCVAAATSAEAERVRQEQEAAATAEAERICQEQEAAAAADEAERQRIIDESARIEVELAE